MQEIAAPRPRPAFPGQPDRPAQDRRRHRSPSRTRSRRDRLGTRRPDGRPGRNGRSRHRRRKGRTARLGLQGTMPANVEVVHADVLEHGFPRDPPPGRRPRAPGRRQHPLLHLHASPLPRPRRPRGLLRLRFPSPEGGRRSHYGRAGLEELRASRHPASERVRSAGRIHGRAGFVLSAAQGPVRPADLAPQARPRSTSAPPTSPSARSSGPLSPNGARCFGIIWPPVRPRPRSPRPTPPLASPGTSGPRSFRPTPSSPSSDPWIPEDRRRT